MRRATAAALDNPSSFGCAAAMLLRCCYVTVLPCCGAAQLSFIVLTVFLLLNVVVAIVVDMFEAEFEAVE